MRTGYLVGGLFLLGAVVLATLAYRASEQRELSTTFSVSGADAVTWAERARKDKWVEFVASAVVDGRLDYVAVPTSEIDELLASGDSLMIRRWLPNDEAAAMIGTLSRGGYSGLADLASETDDVLSSQERAVSLYWGGCALLAALALGSLAATFATRVRR